MFFGGEKMYQFENSYGDQKFYDDLPNSFVPTNGSHPEEYIISLSCPECGGSGTDLDGGQCDYCYGTGSSEYTLVGENKYLSDTQFTDFKYLGFNKIGEWYIDAAKNIIDYKIDNDWKKNRGILYAYVMNDEIKYIGKSMNNIGSRLTEYKNKMNTYYPKNMIGSSKKLHYLYNAIINSRIDFEAFQLDTTKVEIFGFKPSKEIHYNDEIKLDIPHGLEYPLIMKFSPEWNTVGKEKK